MTDIEKVIKGLECCRIDENRHINCADCPYYTDDDKGQMWCSNEINNDAIERLKEQEKKPLRCKNCSYHRDDGWCNEHRREVKETDYCSFGAWKGQ